MLLLLEGEPVYFPTTKNHFKEDEYLTRDTALFVTGKFLITFQGPYNTRDPVEGEMIAARWKVFKFIRHIPIERQKTFPHAQNAFQILS